MDSKTVRVLQTCWNFVSPVIFLTMRVLVVLLVVFEVGVVLTGVHRHHRPLPLQLQEADRHHFLGLKFQKRDVVIMWI